MQRLGIKTFFVRSLGRNMTVREIAIHFKLHQSTVYARGHRNQDFETSPKIGRPLIYFAMYEGKVRTFREISRMSGIPYPTMVQRYKRLQDPLTFHRKKK